MMRAPHPPPPSPLLPVAKVKGYLTFVKSQLDEHHVQRRGPELPSHPSREPSLSSHHHPEDANGHHGRGGGGGMGRAPPDDDRGPEGRARRTLLLRWLQAWALQLELIQRGSDKVLSSSPRPRAASSASSTAASPSSSPCSSSSLASDLVATLQWVREASGKGLLLPDNNEAPSSGDAADAGLLLSNVSALQGRVAEALASTECSLVVRQQEGGGDASGSSWDAGGEVATLLSEVQKRCREVHDERFLSVLNLVSATLPAAATSAASIPKAPAAPAAPSANEEAARAWSYVAEGCYGRAGLLAKTSPPPFKAAWDVVEERWRRRLRRRHEEAEEEPTPESHQLRRRYGWEALEWIAHLRRIAASRNNTKKVVELSLGILEICLRIPSLEGVLSEDDVPSTTGLDSAPAPIPATAEPASHVSAVMKAFVRPVRSIDPPEAKFVLKMCEEQLSHLQEQKPNDAGVELQACTYQLLWTLQKQAHEIEQDGRARHGAAMNRRASAADKAAPAPRSSAAASAAAAPSLPECRRQARIDSFQRMADDDDGGYTRTFLEAGGADALLNVIQRTALVPECVHDVPPGGTSTEHYGEVARVVVVTFLSSWHKDYVQARMLKHQQKPQGGGPLSAGLMEWTQRAVSSLVADWQRAVDVSPPLTVAPPTWIVTLAALIAELEWMLQNVLSTNDGHFFSIDILQAAEKVLQSVLNDSMPSCSSGSGSPPTRQRGDRRSTLEWADRALRALVYLSQQCGDEALSSNLPALISEQMARLAQGSPQNDTAEPLSRSGRYGTAFYEFVVAWSGLSTTVPWPYVVAPEARMVVDQGRLSCQWAEKQLGRTTSDIEEWILKIAMADAEAGIRIAVFSGDSTSGMAGHAKTLYEQVLSEMAAATPFAASGRSLRLLLKSKCCSGLVNIALRSSLGADHVLATMPEDGMRTTEGLSRSNLKLLLQMSSSVESDSWESRRFVGSSPKATDRAFRLQVAYVRNQVSECLLQKGLTEEAGELLQDAAAASPEDPVAAFALGSFRLRIMFFHVDDPSSPEVAKAAQIGLLKAAKLDASKSSPFALLGYWYEFMKDEKRALGCYSKALLLDPWHPVAGRGILRLQPLETLLHLLQKATESGSPYSGWAWKALGLHKAMVEGRDDLAVISYLQTLRCPDVASPSRTDLSIFFASPLRAKEASRFELVDTLAELAECYRRLGRYTASLRTYNKALDSSAGEGAPPPSLLVSCAQVEMALGMFDEASDKFSQAMVVGEDQADSWQSAQGLGICLLSMAKRDHEHGKAGLALQHLQRGIDACRRVERPFGCVQKLLGDLHSLGALLPPEVFSESDVVPDERTEKAEEDIIRRQLAFVECGVRAYELAGTAIRTTSNEDASLAMRSNVAADIGSNLLLQAQLVSLWHGKGVDEMASSETEHLLDRAEKEFRRSIDLSPTSAAAWCGLGCAVHKFDPLLAQHAFCRSIELDPMFPEPYANLGFLYTRCRRLQASEQVCMALTQVADTPMMWMNRALSLERQDGPDTQSRFAGASHPFEQAADAYRAALQVTPLPTAKYGLALTCRRRQSATAALGRVLMDESHCLLTEYNAATGNLDVASRVFGGVATLEGGAGEASPTSSNRLEAGRQQVVTALERLDDSGDDRDGDLDKHIIRTVIGHHPLTGPDANISLSEAETALRGESNVSELQRRLLFEPNRGDLWLALGKALVLAHPQEDASTRSARAAADKACYILSSHAHDPASRLDKHRAASARALSEALALRCWLEMTLGGVPGEGLEASSRTGDLQRALMLCPDNEMAREALMLVSGLKS